MGKVLLNGKLIYSLFHRGLKTVTRNKNMEREDLVKFNEILIKLTVNGFFEHYSELRDYYQYLAVKYHFDLNSYTVDPIDGEIVPINDKDKVYFDKMTT
jgi:hypothetical protein